MLKKLLLVSIPVFLFSNYLIKLDASLKHNLRTLNGQGIVVIDYFGDNLLALSDGNGLKGLTEQGIKYQIIDIDPSQGNYQIVWVFDSKARERLRDIGKIVAHEDDLYLLNTKDQGDIVELNKLKVKLKNLSFDPMITSKDARLSFQPVVKKDTLIQEMANRVSLDTIMTFVRRLQNFRTRYSSTDSARACALWLRNKFISYGFDSVYAETFSASYSANVIAVKKGMVYPGKNYVVGCGHYDCTSGTPTTFAPGADDNGTGTTMALEAARILRNYRFEYSIRLIGFGGEEQGLLGSAYYAQRARSRGDSVLGAINGDMFAYTTPNRDTLMIINDTTYRSNLWLASYFSTCADTYTTLKKRIWTGRRAQSDHASFSRYGYSAIQERENLNVSNPYYHTTGDTIGGGFNAQTMFYQGVRAAVATIASLAIPYRTGIANDFNGKVLDAEFNLYPSVIRAQKLKIRYVIPYSTTLKFVLYNVLGQIKMSQIINLRTSGILEIDLKNCLLPGIYFIQLEIEKRSVIRKIVISG